MFRKSKKAEESKDIQSCSQFLERRKVFSKKEKVAKTSKIYGDKDENWSVFNFLNAILKLDFMSPKNQKSEESVDTQSSRCSKLSKRLFNEK
jgi:hypothetical protein